MKLQTIEPVFFAFYIPEEIEPGKLYISEMYKTAIHLCACGCGERIVTPLIEGQWTLTKNKGKVTLSPSIGNQQQPCKTHYHIIDNQIRWSANF